MIDDRIFIVTLFVAVYWGLSYFSECKKVKALKAKLTRVPWNKGKSSINHTKKK